MTRHYEQVANHTYTRRASANNGLPYKHPHPSHQEEDIYDDVWPPPLPRSAIRYTSTTDRTPVIVSGNRRYVLHNSPPLNQTAYIPRQEEDETPRQRRRVHWSLILGTGMIVMFVLWILGNMLINWWSVMQDDIHYGRPRTFQIDQRVGHGDSGTPSHFIAINLHRRIEIIEFPGGDVTHAKVYFAMTLIGNGEDLAVATLSFKDVNGDGKLDMIVTVGETHYVFINDSGQFRSLKPGEQVTP